MPYHYMPTSVTIRRKIVPSRINEYFTFGHILDYTVEEDTIIKNLKHMKRSKYTIRTDEGTIRVLEMSHRDIMKKCLESGSPITVAHNGFPPPGFNLHPVCSPTPGSVYYTTRDPTYIFVTFEKNMVENKKTETWTCWAFLENDQVV